MSSRPDAFLFLIFINTCLTYKSLIRWGHPAHQQLTTLISFFFNPPHLPNMLFVWTLPPLSSPYAVSPCTPVYSLQSSKCPTSTSNLSKCNSSFHHKVSLSTVHYPDGKYPLPVYITTLAVFVQSPPDHQSLSHPLPEGYTKLI